MLSAAQNAALRIPQDSLRKTKSEPHDEPQATSAAPTAGPEPREIAVLEPEEFLERPLAEIRLPESRAKQMAMLDLQLATPLDLSAVAVLFEKRAARSADNSYFVIRKSSWEEIRERFPRIQQLRLFAATDRGLVELDAAHLTEPKTILQQIRRRLPLWTSIVLVTLALGSFGHLSLRYVLGDGCRRRDDRGPRAGCKGGQPPRGCTPGAA